jgi:hypothetical protein
MSIKKQYRFKTETEFKAEFGKKWWDKVPYGWVRANINGDHMDELFGQLFTGILPTKKRESRTVGYGWSISSDMLTTRRLPKLLSDGTIAKIGMKVMWSDGIREFPAIIQRIYNEDDNRIDIICICRLCKGNTHYYMSLKDIYKNPK